MPLNFNKAEFVRSAGEPKDFLRPGPALLFRAGYLGIAVSRAEKGSGKDELLRLLVDACRG